MAPDPKTPRVETSSDSKGDPEFPNRRAASPPASFLITVATEQVQLAGKDPSRGWPPRSLLYPEGNPTGVSNDPELNPENFRQRAANDGWVAGAATDPLAAALKAARATPVGPGEIRTLDGNAALLRPLLGRGFQIWELPHRSARDGKQCPNWRFGSRRGPDASGIYSQMVSTLGATHPGIPLEP